MAALVRVFLALLVLCGAARAINLPTTPGDYSVSTALTGTGDVAVQVNGTSSVFVSASGSGTGLAFAFQCFDGNAWQSINAYPLSSGALAAPVTTGSANGVWFINSAACAASSNAGVRVHLTAISGGTETFKLNASAGVGPNSVNLIPGGAVQANAGTNLNTSLLALESGGNLATLAGGVSASVYQENLKQVNGVTTLTGTGAVGTGAQRVAVGTDTATIAGSAPGTAGTASSNVVTVQGIASMTKLLVTPDSVALPANQSVNVAQINAQTAANGAVTGSLLVEQGCAGQTVANTTVTAINNAGSSSNLKLVSKVSAKNVYICALNLVAAAATNVALVDGTKTTNECDTSTAGMAGGATAATGWNLAANGGLTVGNGQGVVFKTTGTNLDVCLLFSAGNQVSGSITWAQF